MTETRLIHRTAAAPNQAISECLEAMLISEFLDPGARLLVVSPWMSDFPALDNRVNQWSTIDAGWSTSFVPFSQVLRTLASRGVNIQIGCGPGERESEFVSRLQRGVVADGTEAKLTVSRMPHEHRLFSHEKALVADTWAIYGSMNLTYSGVQMNGELITVTVAPHTVSTVATELLGLFS